MFTFLSKEVSLDIARRRYQRMKKEEAKIRYAELALEMKKLEAIIEQPGKKKLNWSKMPMDTLVRVTDESGKQYLRYLADQFKNVYYTGQTTTTAGNALLASFQKIELAEAPNFTFWDAKPDSVCPFPEGVMVEVVLRSPNISKVRREVTYLSWGLTGDDDDIIAYRVIGLADGWEN